MFEPTNEMGVFYLFSKYHKELEFEEILSFQKFPDVIALRDGIPVRIELEYKASRFHHHFKGHRRATPWVSYLPGKRIFKEDPVDIVICWRKDKPLEYPVEVIELDGIAFRHFNQIE